MPKAIWNDVVIAESDIYEIMEGNIYFPAENVKMDYLKPNDTHTTCHWKGVASYYDVEVNDMVNKDAAWYYPDPKEAAANIKGHIAFWRGVKIEM